MGKTYYCGDCGWEDWMYRYCIKCAEKEAEERRRAHEKQEAEKNRTRAREAEQHQRKLLEMKQAAEKLRQEERQKQVEDLQAEVKTYEESIKTLDDSIQKNNTKKVEKLKLAADVMDKIQSFDESKSMKNLEPKRENVQNLRKEYDAACKEINATIEKTGVDDENIGRLLQLVDGIIGATIANQANAESLSQQVATVSTTFVREAGSIGDEKDDGADNGADDGAEETRLENVLKKPKQKGLLKILQDAGFETMEDLKCDDEDDFNDIWEAVNDDLEEKLKASDKIQLRNLCLSKDARNKEKDRKDKIKYLKERLNSYAAPMRLFFSGMSDGMKQAQAVLEYSGPDNLSVDQKKAIKSIEARAQESAENKDQDQKDPDEIGGVSETKLALADRNCNRLRDAAVARINVVQNIKQFVTDDEKSMVKNAESLAVAIEDSSTHLLKSQADIRKSVILAKLTLDLKPAQLTKESESLWMSIDDGVYQILTKYLDINKVSAEYQSFYYKFRQSFGFYLSAPKDVSLNVSAEHIFKDVKDFVAFTKVFVGKIDGLRGSAEECIKSCIKTHIGGEQYQKFLKKRKDKCAEWLEAKAKFDDEEDKVLQEKRKLVVAQTELNAEINNADFVIEALKNDKQNQQKRLNNTIEVLKKIQSTL